MPASGGKSDTKSLLFKFDAPRQPGPLGPGVRHLEEGDTPDAKRPRHLGYATRVSAQTINYGSAGEDVEETAPAPVQSPRRDQTATSLLAR